MKRYKLTLDGIQYSLSETQFAMLSHRKLNPEDPMTWAFEQRIKGLVKKGLSRKWNGVYERTQKGFRVWREITNRQLKKEQTGITVIAPSL
jgi:hypothetical protein